MFVWIDANTPIRPCHFTTQILIRNLTKPNQTKRFSLIVWWIGLVHGKISTLQRSNINVAMKSSLFIWLWHLWTIQFCIGHSIMVCQHLSCSIEVLWTLFNGVRNFVCNNSHINGYILFKQGQWNTPVCERAASSAKTIRPFLFVLVHY